MRGGQTGGDIVTMRTRWRGGDIGQDHGRESGDIALGPGPETEMLKDRAAETITDTATATVMIDEENETIVLEAATETEIADAVQDPPTKTDGGEMTDD